MNNLFKGFYKLSLKRKLELLISNHWISNIPVPLNIDQADKMIENVIGTYQLPLAVGVNFTINNQNYVVPMAIEEASVVAAASNAAKYMKNITSINDNKEIMGQIIIDANNITNPQESVELVNQHADQLLDIAKLYSPNMVARGGGPKNITAKIQKNKENLFICVYLTFDPCDAMGANSINTVLENLAPNIEKIVNGKSLMCILTNYNDASLTKAITKINIADLSDNIEEAFLIANRIVLASEYAQIDMYRAVTHNKGIMNGIDAVLLATANDWRAVEASIHAYASRNGKYQGLSQWSIVDEYLIGELTLPLPVATVGGSISNHPTAQWSLELLNNPSAKEFSEILCAVGLALNFSALKALVSDGIQKGHMSMQARNLAMAAGAQLDEVDEVVAQLINVPIMNSTEAKKIIINLRKNNLK